MRSSRRCSACAPPSCCFRCKFRRRTRRTTTMKLMPPVSSSLRERGAATSYRAARDRGRLGSPHHHRQPVARAGARRRLERRPRSGDRADAAPKSHAARARLLVTSAKRRRTRSRSAGLPDSRRVRRRRSRIGDLAGNGPSLFDSKGRARGHALDRARRKRRTGLYRRHRRGRRRCRVAFRFESAASVSPCPSTTSKSISTATTHATDSRGPR